MLSTNLIAALAVAFFVGLAIFATGTLILRFTDHAPNLKFPRFARRSSPRESTEPSAVAPMLDALFAVQPRVATPVEQESVVRSVPAELVPHEVRTVLSKRGWVHELVGDDEGLDEVLRLDMVERLAIVGEPWSMELLARAAQEDAAVSVRNAASAAIYGSIA